MRWKCEIEYCSKWAESVAGNRWRFLCFCFRWGPKGPALLGGSSSPGHRLSAAAAFRRAFLGLVCNKVTRRRSKDVLFPPSDFGVQRHGGATFWTAFHAFSDGPGTSPCFAAVGPLWLMRLSERGRDPRCEVLPVPAEEVYQDLRLSQGRLLGSIQFLAMLMMIKSIHQLNRCSKRGEGELQFFFFLQLWGTKRKQVLHISWTQTTGDRIELEAYNFM